MTGARTALGGPAEELLLAYRGAAYFLRWLALLPESTYDEPGHPAAPADRRTMIATVGYDARGWANFAEGLRERNPRPHTFAAGEREAEISWGATLPPRALRNLVEHSAVHLAVEWRDLPADSWNGQGIDGEGNPLSIDQTPWLRARQTWLAAFDLGIGGSFSDFPTVMLDRLIDEHGGHLIPGEVGCRVEWRGSTVVGTRSSIARRMLRNSAPDRVLASTKGS